MNTLLQLFFTSYLFCPFRQRKNVQRQNQNGLYELDVLYCIRSPSLGANNVLFLVEISFSQTKLILVLNFPRKIYAS